MRFAPSPLNRRRWQNFKSNRRGYWSFWIFLILFLVSLFAELIANDRPFLIKYRRPSVLAGLRQLFRDHFRRRLRNRRRLSRSLSAEADRGQGRHHRLAADPLFLRHPQSRPADAGAVEADLDADRSAVQGGGAEEGPEGCRDLEYNWLGTDDQGRDVVARLIYGFRISVLFGLTPHHRLLDHRHRRRRRGHSHPLLSP